MQSKPIRIFLRSRVLDAFTLICIPFLSIYTTDYALNDFKGWSALLIVVVAMSRLLIKDFLSDSAQSFSANSKGKKLSKSLKPSPLSLLIAGILHDAESREYSLGCLEERFSNDVKKRGHFYAKCMIWRDNFETFLMKFGTKTIKIFKWLGLSLLVKKVVLFLSQYFLGK